VRGFFGARSERGVITRGALFGMIVIVVLIVVGATGAVLYERKQEARRQEMRDVFGDLVAKARNLDGYRVCAQGEERREGKCVIVCDGEPDLMTHDLPDHVRAATAAETGTVVNIRWSEQQVGKYSDGAAGYRQHADVRVILPESRVYFDAHFSGGMPPERKKHSGSAHGSRPDGEVMSFILRLREAPIPKPSPAPSTQPVPPVPDET